MNIFVGNLSKEVTEEEVKNLFSEQGQVKSVKIIRDMFSQESKGFGFVEMQSVSEGQKAIKELNGKEMKSKNIVVNEARPKNDSRKSGGNNRFGYGNNRRFR